MRYDALVDRLSAVGLGNAAWLFGWLFKSIGTGLILNPEWFQLGLLWSLREDFVLGGGGGRRGSYLLLCRLL